MFVQAQKGSIHFTELAERVEYVNFVQSGITDPKEAWGPQGSRKGGTRASRRAAKAAPAASSGGGFSGFERRSLSPRPARGRRQSERRRTVAASPTPPGPEALIVCASAKARASARAPSRRDSANRRTRQPCREKLHRPAFAGPPNLNEAVRIASGVCEVVCLERGRGLRPHLGGPPDASHGGARPGRLLVCSLCSLLCCCVCCFSPGRLLSRLLMWISGGLRCSWKTGRVRSARP